VISKLKEGMFASQIAKELKVSVPAVSRVIHSLILAGRIRKERSYPFQYKVLDIQDKADQKGSMGDIGLTIATVNNPLRVVEPHRFGAWFDVITGSVGGVLSWRLRGGGEVRKFVGDGYTVVAYKRCFVVWLKKFKGFSPLEQYQKGAEEIGFLAKEFANRWGLEVKFRGWCDNGPEWATTIMGRGLSKELIDRLELARAPVRVGEVVWKTDKSHPEKAELNHDRPLEGVVYAESLHKLVVSQGDLFKFVEQQAAINAQLFEILGYVKRDSKGLSERDVRDVV